MAKAVSLHGSCAQRETYGIWARTGGRRCAPQARCRDPAPL